MKKSRLGEEQVIGILKEAETGIKTADLVRPEAWDQPEDVLPVEGLVRGAWPSPTLSGCGTSKTKTAG